jgi:hypothetical protein
MPAALKSHVNWGVFQDVETYGISLFAALAHDVELEPGESTDFEMLLADGCHETATLRAVLASVDGELENVEKL